MKNPKGLRKWQAKHLDAALEHFALKNRIWLSQVVTGGGKTRFGGHVGASLLDASEVNRIIVLAPSVGIADGWVRTFNRTIGTMACYKTDIMASSSAICADDVNVIISTYHGAGKIEGTSRTLLILDEIHHAERDASWGLTADKIASECKYTLALTGTPWMTRGKIALLEKNGYYVSAENACDKHPADTIKANATHSYSDDLNGPNEERATVPLRCTFFGSTAKKISENEDGKEVLSELKLHQVTDENLENTIKAADTTIPLRPHVTIEDNLLSTNTMARDLLNAAMTELDRLAESEVFKRGKKKPMGLVTCSSIAESIKIGEYMTAQDVTVEVIHSDDEKAADRLRALSEGKDTNPPQWLVTVGMVSEGVDIPAIKVLAYLNSITTDLFLVQFIGRSLRRIPAQGGYLDKTITETTARLFAPAHPRIVKVGTELEKIGNQAIKEKKPSEPGGEGPQTPRERDQYETSTDGATVFYRGHPVHDADLIRKLNAIQSDIEAMETLTPQWLDWVHSLIMAGNERIAVSEVDRQLQQFSIEWGAESKNFKEGMDYDVERGLLLKEAARLVSQIRFGHPAFRYMTDENAFSEVRRSVCAAALGKFKKSNKMTLAELRRFVAEAKRLLRETNQEAA